MKQSISLLASATLAVTLAAGAMAAPKTFVYCSDANPEGFNPVFYTLPTTFDASSRPLFNRLVEFERGGTTIVPGLAESWSVSADGRTYTFKLRRGVKFHQRKDFRASRDFNADDIVFSINRQLKDSHPYHNVGGKSYDYFNSMGMGNLLASVEKLDDYSVRFQLNFADPTFLANMAMDFGSIMSSEYADAMMADGTPEQFDKTPIGTGPFILARYRKGSVIRYVAHHAYWEGRPALDYLVFSITPDAKVRNAKLHAGECHLIPDPADPVDLAALRQNSLIKVLESNRLDIGYLAFNVQKAPFDNPLVRQALNMATNKEAILAAVYQAAGTLAKNPIPPAMWSYNDKLVDYDYDPKAAKALLTEAGFPNGFATDLWAMPVERPYNPNGRRMAEMMQQDWAKIGVRANIVSYRWPEYLERSKNGEHDTAMFGWTSDNGDPDHFLYELLGCDSSNNRAFWCNEAFQTLIEAAQVTTDFDARSALYKEAQAIVKAAAPWIPLAHSVVFQPMRTNVTGYQVSPFGGHDFYQVHLVEKWVDMAQSSTKGRVQPSMDTIAQAAEPPGTVLGD